MKLQRALLMTLAATSIAPGGVALADSLLINGAGATFPFPLYSKWFSEYNKLHPDLKFNYQSIGSGGGVKQITEKTVDFGASDAPMTIEELAKAQGIVHIPAVLGSVVVVYNGAPEGLKLEGAVLADIFLGKIKKWNDPAIVASNKGLKLPETAIAVAHRSDGSGTTAVFTDYLAKVSPAWKTRVGEGKSVKFPVGIGGKGNEGVTGVIKSTPGTIGYVELAYARQNKLPMAAIKNASGEFVVPSVESTSAAASGVALPADYRVSITNPSGKGAYPIASFTYLLVYRDQGDARKGEALINFLWWAIHDGQKMAAPLDYAPLPDAARTQIEATLKELTVKGKKALATR